jgi:DUF2075 family protein
MITSLYLHTFGYDFKGVIISRKQKYEDSQGVIISRKQKYEDTKGVIISRKQKYEGLRLMITSLYLHTFGYDL